MEVTYQRVKKGSFMEFVKGEKEISIKEWMLGLLKVLISRACCKWETTWNAHYAHNF